MPPARFATLIRLVSVQALVLIWVVLLGVLVVMQRSGTLSDSAVRVFTLILAAVALAGPFAIIAAFLRRRALADRRTAVDGCCPRCRYDLRGLPGWTDPHLPDTVKPIQCPECGEMVHRPTSITGTGPDAHRKSG